MLLLFCAFSVYLSLSSRYQGCHKEFTPKQEEEDGTHTEVQLFAFVAATFARYPITSTVLFLVSSLSRVFHIGFTPMEDFIVASSRWAFRACIKLPFGTPHSLTIRWNIKIRLASYGAINYNENDCTRRGYKVCLGGSVNDFNLIKYHMRVGNIRGGGNITQSGIGLDRLTMGECDSNWN